MLFYEDLFHRRPTFQRPGFADGMNAFNDAQDLVCFNNRVGPAELCSFRPACPDPSRTRQISRQLRCNITPPSSFYILPQPGVCTIS